jgi:hypothetical protein
MTDFSMIDLSDPGEPSSTHSHPLIRAAIEHAVSVGADFEMDDLTDEDGQPIPPLDLIAQLLMPRITEITVAGMMHEDEPCRGECVVALLSSLVTIKVGLDHYLHHLASVVSEGHTRDNPMEGN